MINNKVCYDLENANTNHKQIFPKYEPNLENADNTEPKLSSFFIFFQQPIKQKLKLREKKKKTQVYGTSSDETIPTSA